MYHIVKLPGVIITKCLKSRKNEYLVVICVLGNVSLYSFAFFQAVDNYHKALALFVAENTKYKQCEAQMKKEGTSGTRCLIPVQVQVQLQLQQISS